MREKFNYKKYLASREWAQKKELIKKRSNGWCERCLVGEYESTHHLTYENIGNERLKDLLAVCNSCHEYLSAKSDHDPRRGLVPWIILGPDCNTPNFNEFIESISLNRTRIIGGFIRSGEARFAIDPSNFFDEVPQNANGLSAGLLA